ncbi:unnamed protein product, partial [Polarella glacialis]
VLLQQNLWRLLFQALQAALCDPALNLGLACNGTLSRHGDRLRVSGALSTTTNHKNNNDNNDNNDNDNNNKNNNNDISNNSSNSNNNNNYNKDNKNNISQLLVYLEAVPARADGAELLRDDLKSLAAALGQEGGFEAPGHDLFGPPAAANIDPPGPAFNNNSSSNSHNNNRNNNNDNNKNNNNKINNNDNNNNNINWIFAGFGSLWGSPQLFGVRPESQFSNQSWFPSVRFSFSGEPYIINHRSVPDWELEVVPAPAVDSRLGLLSSLAEMERLALEVSCGLLGASWLGLFLMRCLGWRVLFGKKGSPWQLAQTSRGLSLIALLTDFVELLLASLVFGFSLWLSRSHFEETSQQWLSRLAAAIGLFVALLVAALPLSRLSLQLLMAEGAGMLPSSRRLCRRRLPRQKWIRLLFLVILWHGLALVAALVTTGSKLRRDVF